MEIYTKIKNVAIYSRKSRPGETDEAIHRQLQILIDMAEKNNWKYDVYQEVGSSMSMDERDRPELNKMLHKIQTYEYDAVLVTDADRISRDIEHSSYIKKLFANYGVKLITTTKVYDYEKQEDDLMSDMMAIIAKQEYINTKKRLMRGKKAAAAEGKWQGGPPPFGYKVNRDTGKLVIDETEAPTVRKIFELYVNGITSTDIEYKLDHDGVRTPTGKKYSNSAINTMLKNKVYIGTLVFGKTVSSKVEKYASGKAKPISVSEEMQTIVEHAHPPIIDIKDWEKVEQLRKSRLKQPVASRIGKNPFSSLIECSLCGAKLTFCKEKKQDKIRIGSCKTRHYREDGTYTICLNQGLYLDVFERTFFSGLSKFVDELNNKLNSVKENMGEKDVFNPEKEINEINKKIKKLDAQIKNVQRGFISGILEEDEAKSETNRIKLMKKGLEKEVYTIQNTPVEDKVGTLEQIVNDLKGIMTGKTILENKDINQVFKTIIEKIEYTRIAKIKGSPKSAFQIKIHYKSNDLL